MKIYQEWLAKRYVTKKLKKCNYEFAHYLLVSHFKGQVLPKKLVSLLDGFDENPCLETAVALVNYNSDFAAAFELARKGGFTERLYRNTKLDNKGKDDEVI